MSATIDEKLKLLREGFDSGITLPVENRLQLLRKLDGALHANEARISGALHADLNKSVQEAYMTEIGLVYDELRYAIRKLRKWAKPRLVRTPVGNFPGVSYVYPQPHGVTLIMSPWNYPFMLTLAPLIGALAGGNTVMVKPSNYSPNMSGVLAEIFAATFDETVVQTVLGGHEANSQLLENKFDYVFFTGSVKVGKIVMHSCAEHLTPLTLELGGKSPCIVAEDADIKLAAKRIGWAKFVNAGQTCVAPDYILVHESKRLQLLTELKAAIPKMYGADTLNNPDFPHIINGKHFERLAGLIAAPESRVAFGGKSDPGKCLIEPTILADVKWDDPIMQEEIFGPILPILSYNDVDEMISTLRARPRSLALYLYTRSKELEQRVIDELHFGGGCVNDCLVHLATKYMPFGGVGDSGMGGYHGEWSFKTFTREKSVLKRGNLDVPLRYPPYTKGKLGIIRKIM